MKTVKCPQCSMVNWATLDFCKRCGFGLTAAIEAAAAKESMKAEMFAAEMPSVGYQKSSQTSTSSFAPTDFSQQTGGSYQQESGWNNQSSHQTQSNWGDQNSYQQQSRNNNSNYQNRGDYRGTHANTNSKMATSSMVLGILCFLGINFIIGGLLGFVLSLVFGAIGFAIGLIAGLAIIPIGLAMGITALRRTNKEPRKFGGRGFAIAGIALNGVSLLVIPVIGIIAAIAIPNLLAARRSANEGSAISTVRKIAEAENRYMASMQGKCGDLQSLVAGQLVDASLSKSERSGYRFTVTNLPMGGCEIHAVPMIAQGTSSTGTRSFYTASDDSWTIRAATNGGKPADKNAPALNTGY